MCGYAILFLALLVLGIGLTVGIIVIDLIFW